ncbi:MAG TPA: hypothetical protein VD969_02990 [Symbiobacteriaceae bacterium]|nr:hypothetical protein [Symbiobacteriaceae bacterium]
MTRFKAKVAVHLILVRDGTTLLDGKGAELPVAAENEKRIAELKEQIEKAKQLKYKYEARLDELQRQKERLLQELADLKVHPEELDGEISRLRTEVESLLREAASLLPSDLLKG